MGLNPVEVPKIFFRFIRNCLNCNKHSDDHVFIRNLYFRSLHHLHVSFLSGVKMNSTNWPAPNVWVFMAQMVEYCSGNADEGGSNPIEVPKKKVLNRV